MAKTQMKSFTLAEMKDKYIGKEGTEQRDQYEYELRMDVLGRMIKKAAKVHERIGRARECYASVQYY